MLRILADYHNLAFSSDNLALLAHFLNGRFHFHNIFASISAYLFGPVGYPALTEIIYRYFDRDLVARIDFNVVHSHLTGDVGGNHVTVVQPDFEDRVRKQLRYNALKFNNIVFNQNYSSLSV